jgi:hypothetical protein
MARYKIIQFTPDEDDDDPSWDATDWCYIVTAAHDDDDIVCICATEGEAQHIHSLLEEKPYSAAPSTGQ